MTATKPTDTLQPLTSDPPSPPKRTREIADSWDQQTYRNVRRQFEGLGR
jgi:hypothetical protein